VLWWTSRARYSGLVVACGAHDRPRRVRSRRCAASVARWHAMAVSGIYLRHAETYVAMRETPYGAEEFFSN
jgi:hypothetical protein